ncbi:MAG: hypothetical protein C0404_07910 [Verrucomicrobia bacterium]|nr:hypothetical protein [Verrucomicrobiota bacterium]
MSTCEQDPGREKLRAFEAVVSSYESALLRYASRLVHHHDAAQNIVQDAFIKLFKSWEHEMLPSSKMLNWLYRVTHNCAVDYLRKETRLQVLHIRQAQETPKAVAPDRGDGTGISEEAERAAAILTQLTLREQQLVILKVYEDKSYTEIAEITGLTVSNVGYILHHAMKKMAAELRRARAI